MYHIIICDDDRPSISRLKRLIQEIITEVFLLDTVVFYEYLSGKEMIDSVSSINECDLLMLDMKMPDMDGDDTAKCFRKMFPNAVLVFCTGEVMPSVRSFEAEPYRYLLKGYNDEEMLEKLKDIINKMIDRKKHTHVFIEDKKEKYFLRVSDIAYVEIKDRGCNIYFIKDEKSKNDFIHVNKTITKLKTVFSEYHFAVPHKSFLVNLEHILTVKKEMLILEDGQTLAIASKKAKEFRQEYMKYMGS